MSDLQFWSTVVVYIVGAIAYRGWHLEGVPLKPDWGEQYDEWYRKYSGIYLNGNFGALIWPAMLTFYGLRYIIRFISRSSGQVARKSRARIARQHERAQRLLRLEAENEEVLKAMEIAAEKELRLGLRGQ